MPQASIETGVSLLALNTLAIPATAAFCVTCTSVDQVRASLAFAQQRSLPVLILGEGSNTVFTKNYAGLVILNRLRGVKTLGQHDDQIEISVAAGENWHALVEYAITQAWFGLENLALIPGLVGASPIQNIGAYGVEVKDFVSSVDYLDIESGELCRLTNAQCQFAYRDSIFKHALAGKAIITAVNFVLSRTPNCNLSYPALASRVGGAPSPRAVFDAVCAIRQHKLPSPDDIPNAGSFFKNPVVSAEHYHALLVKHPNLIGFDYGDGFKLAAAWLIEHLGWKSKSVDGVKVHHDHALVITNPLQRTGESVLALAQAIQEDVRTRFSVELEIEPRLY